MNKRIKNKKSKFYGIYSKNDNFLYGVFPFSKDGYKLAEKYIEKIKTGRSKYYIKSK